MKSFVTKVLRRLPGVKLIYQKFDAIHDVMIEQERMHQRTIDDLTKDMQQKAAEWNEKFFALQSMYEKQCNDMRLELQEANNKNQKQLTDIKTTLIEELEIQRKRSVLQRFSLKRAAGLPVKVVFLIEEPSVIKNILSVIEAINNDKRFEAILVNLWYKVYKDENYTYTRPKIESVLDAKQYTVIEAYDEASGKWLNLEELMPDYVFFSRPYDFYRKETYHIGEVAKYARTCYVPYGIQTIGGDVERLVLTPESAQLYYFFMDNRVRRDYIANAMQQTPFAKNGHLVYKGYPGMDMLQKRSDIKENSRDCFTILWLPRWNNSENNCHFFEYKDVLTKFAQQYKDCRVILRPHPLCFDNFMNTGEMTKRELEQLRKNYSEPNEIDEKGNYLDSFSESSVLVADETSLIAEYFLTEKPIVFCKKETHFSTLMEKLIEGCYVVESEEELVGVLEELKNGSDNLKSKRKEITKGFLLDYGASAADNIKEELWVDFTCIDKYD